MHAGTADVLIVGGSYVGQTFALALAHEFGPDLRICIIDRNAAPTSDFGSDLGIDDRDPRASALSAGSRNLLQTLGLWHRLDDVAVAVSEIELTDSSLTAGVRRRLLTYDNRSADGVQASWIVPNAHLAAALEQCIAATPSIEMVRQASVRSVDNKPDQVTITLADGRVLHAPLLVAADGRRSSVREAVGIKSVQWDHGQIGIVTAITHELDHQNRAIQHFLPGGPFAMLPLKGGHRSCVTWSETADEARRILALDDSAFLEEVDRRAAGRLGAVTLDGPRKSWPLETHLARSYTANRVALIGDAAHGVHPIAGQGLNLGMRDIAALVECVVDAAHVGLDIGNADTLARYERWRRFDTTVSTATFSGLNRLFSNDWALMRSAREVGLGVLDQMPRIKQAFVTEAAGLNGELPKLLQNQRAP